MNWLIIYFVAGFFTLFLLLTELRPIKVKDLPLILGLSFTCWFMVVTVAIVESLETKEFHFLRKCADLWAKFCNYEVISG